MKRCFHAILLLTVGVGVGTLLVGAASQGQPATRRGVAARIDVVS